MKQAGDLLARSWNFIARALALVFFVGAGAGITVSIWMLHPAPVVYPALYGATLGYIIWHERTRSHGRH